MIMNVKKINKDAKIPSYGSEFSAGADLYACEENERTIIPHEIPYWDLMLNNVVKSNRNEYFFTENGKKPEINIDESWKDF